MLELVGLSQFAKRYPNQLSGGLFAAGVVTGGVHVSNRLGGSLFFLLSRRKDVESPHQTSRMLNTQSAKANPFALLMLTQKTRVVKPFG